jgi:hypothetical protein
VYLKYNIKYVNDIMDFRKMRYFDSTRSPMHHAMPTTGAVSRYPVVKEVNIFTHWKWHLRPTQNKNIPSNFWLSMDFGRSCLTLYGYLLCLYRINSPIPSYVNLVPSAVWYWGSFHVVHNLDVTAESRSDTTIYNAKN